jgi:hypothetical protein
VIIKGASRYWLLAEGDYEHTSVVALTSCAYYLVCDAADCPKETIFPRLAG